MACFINLFRALAAAVISLVLLLSISLLQYFTGNDIESGTAGKKNISKVARVVKQKEDRKEKERRIRDITTVRNRRISGEMKMRFSPDLSVAQGAGVSVASQNMEAVIFEEGETDEDIVPRLVTQIPYPERARSLGIEGVLKVEILIGRDGAVESVEILKSPHPSISRAARKTVSGWKFRPGMKDGIPVRVRAVKEIEFRLD